MPWHIEFMRKHTQAHTYALYIRNFSLLVCLSSKENIGILNEMLLPVNEIKLRIAIRCYQCINIQTYAFWNVFSNNKIRVLLCCKRVAKHLLLAISAILEKYAFRQSKRWCISAYKLWQFAILFCICSMWSFDKEVFDDFDKCLCETLLYDIQNFVNRVLQEHWVGKSNARQLESLWNFLMNIFCKENTGRNKIQIFNRFSFQLCIC